MGRSAKKTLNLFLHVEGFLCSACDYFRSMAKRIRMVPCCAGPLLPKAWFMRNLNRSGRWFAVLGITQAIQDIPGVFVDQETDI